MKILEIGPARSGVAFPGSDSVDSVNVHGLTFIAKWGFDKFPVEDMTYDIVYASHVLEHVPWFKTQDALLEAYRILKPGGKLEVWVPDFNVIVREYHKCISGIPEDWNPHNHENELMKWIAGRLYAGTTPDEESSWHKAVFDRLYLSRCFRLAGFREVKSLDKQPAGQHVNHEFINLGVSGIR